ncbi:MAG: hypothetical protein IJU23_13430 [Proteobacteria bacterium]|nr:hypothetical protein [Pseudomonadota bacterium]
MKRILCLDFLLFSTVICLSACQELKARDEANEGKDALIECDFESAFLHFTNAHDIIDDNDDINIGLATSELLLTLDSEEFTLIFNRLGFTQSIGEFCQQNIHNEQKQQTSSDGCQTSIRTQNIKLPHPCASLEQCHYSDYIDTELTWNDILSAFELHRTHFEHISTLFAQTASHLEGNYSIHDVFGMDTLNIHPADLYFFAAMTDLSLFITSAAGHYKNTFSVYQTLQTQECQPYSEFLNQNIGIASEPVDISKYEPQFISALSHIHHAFQNSKKIREDFDASTDPCPPRVSLLQWQNVPYGVTDNILSLTAAFQSNPYIIKDILSPDISIDLKALFSAFPVRLTEQTLASCDHDNHIEINYAIYIEAINACTSPALFSTDSNQFELAPGLSYRLSSGWRHWTPVDLF